MIRHILLIAMLAGGLPARADTTILTDQNWESRFVRAPGLDGDAFTMLVVGTNLYVGGTFSTTGVSNTAGVARWDGNSWHSVGGGIIGTVLALTTDGTNLYAGGNFNSAGGVSATNIAQWDGTNWSSLGSALLPNTFNPHGGQVTSLLWDQGLYAAGMFVQIGGISATNIARWDGQTWHALGDGLGAFGFGADIFQVFCLAKHNNELYAGGLFPRSGEVAITNLARWNGTAWEPVGGGVSGGGGVVYWFDGQTGYLHSGAVYALNSSATGLMVGGDFTSAGETGATNIAVWNGTNWSAIGGDCDAAVQRITADGLDQLVHGSFSSIGGVPASGIARWNGVTWSALGQGVIPAALTSARVGTNFYVGGRFQIAGGQSAGYIARWDGADWQALTPGNSTAPDDFVSSLIAAPDGSLYAAGGFQSVSGVAANHVARYDGTNWHSLGNGFTGNTIPRLAWAGTNLYGINNNVLGWTGSDWELVGGGLGYDDNTPIISSFAASSTNLFVSGRFTSAGGMPAANLARWNGSQWSAIPLPPSTFCASTLAPVATQADALYVCLQGSCFPGPTRQVQIKKWDDVQWSDVSTTFSLADVTQSFPHIASMTVVGTNIFLAGRFAVTNEFTATNLVRWNGATWSGMDHPFDAQDSLFPVTHNGTNLFVAAYNYGPPAVGRIARWDGSHWQMLGSGLQHQSGFAEVSSLAMRGRDLYVGGRFSTAGGKPANNLAFWRDLPEITLSGRGWQPSGHFGLRIHGGKDQWVHLQTSTNLQTWLDLGPELPASNEHDWEDSTSASGAARFYRARLIP
jgi:trimeric autotransporter adhesin